ncbi:MAG: hypothetical protein ACE37I_18150, partial [Rubinisphaera brasiliensis]|uniref:hypothetical protein n=1 Tax=Rubinisphaera brasiliensis TaxID=119 RepID=UPI00391A2248
SWAFPRPRLQPRVVRFVLETEVTPAFTRSEKVAPFYLRYPRAPMFVLRSLGTIRDQLVRRAGALTRPQGKHCLKVAAPAPARAEFNELLEHLQAA